MANRNLTEMAIYNQNFVFSKSDFWAGLMVSVECSTGFGLLLAVIIGCFRIPIFKNNPFGLLMINQNVCQIIACANSGFFYIFGVFFNIKVVQDHSNYSGNLSNYLLAIILGGFFLMSLNRFCATTFVFAYKKIFSLSRTKFAIYFSWIFSFIICCYIFGFRECNFVFYHFGWVFTGAPYTENCGDLVVMYNTATQLTLSSSIFTLDILTFIMLVILRKKVYAKQSKAAKRREVFFALQVLIQGGVFLMVGFWYDQGYRWIPGNDERWKMFFTSTFSANLMHTFDPIIVFIFNPEFRQWMFNSCFCSALPKRQSTIVSVIHSS